MNRGLFSEFTEEDAQKAWKVLSDAIDKIYQKNYSELSYEELYKNAYHLVLHRYGEMTYKNLQETIEKNLRRYYQSLSQKQEESFLNNFNNIWIDAKEMLKAISQIFLYMDKNYVAKQCINPIKIMGYQIFKKVFLDDPLLRRKLITELLILIRQERDGFKIDRMLIKNLLIMLVSHILNF